MLTTSEMIFGMVGLLILLLGSIGVLGLRMLTRLRSDSASPSARGAGPASSERSSHEVSPP